MTLEVLSSSESMSLYRGAANLVLNRFRWLARRAASENQPLTLLFADLVSDVERNLMEIRQLEGQGHPPGAHEQETGQTAARGFLPSLSKTAGEGPLDVESGFFLVECILEELARFYGALVRQTCDETSRDFLRRSRKTVNDRLEFLHQVLLNETVSASSLGHSGPGLLQVVLPDSEP